MASKRRNMFQKNKTQETTENGLVFSFRYGWEESIIFFYFGDTGPRAYDNGTPNQTGRRLRSGGRFHHRCARDNFNGGCGKYWQELDKEWGPVGVPMKVHYSLLCLFLLLGPSTGQLFPFTNIRHYFDRLNGISKTQERPEGNLERPYRHLEVNKTATSKVPDKKTVVVKHADPTESTTTRVRTTESIVFVTPRKPPVSEVVLSPPARTSPEKKRRRQKVVKPSTRFRQRTKYAQPQPAESTLVETFPSVGLPGGAELPLYLVPPRHPSIYEAEDRLQQEYEILKRPARVRRPPTSKRTTIHHPTNRRPPDGSRTRPAEVVQNLL
ncbi:hypothetical protein AAG570_011006 [Ranatra chinensis]|uniref:Uncharacterized protein n=1 Tax=Ranatra chinensis TaxID=642074 RepID=A0ABD0YLH3_9HEMI